MERLPAPQAKHRLMEEYASKHNLTVFVESGTATGDSVQAARAWASEIHSIELNKHVYMDAVFRFSEVMHRHRIHLYCGDSAEVMRAVVAGIREPALFWLDGHYDGEGSASAADYETPALKEMELIDKFGMKGVVLVDDARLFGCSNYGRGHRWPKVQELQAALGGRPYEWTDDILRFIL